MKKAKFVALSATAAGIVLGTHAMAGLSTAQVPAMPIKPGEWETTAKINASDMPGPGSLIAKLMKGKTTTVRYCLTPEEAARGPQDMLKQNPSCTFTRYSMTGSQLSAEMVCERGSDTMTVATTATFTPTQFSGSTQMTSSGRSGLSFSGTSMGKWVGPCT